jgi:hypothetical protein
MMRYSSFRQQQRFPTALARPLPPRNRYDGYQFSLFAPPSQAAATRSENEPYTVRAVAPSLRPLVARTGNRCPECAGPLINGEACVACPVCGFRRQGW